MILATFVLDVTFVKCIHILCDIFCNHITCQNEFIIIIINFYGAYILRNLSSEAQQNIFIKHSRDGAPIYISVFSIFQIKSQVGC